MAQNSSIRYRIEDLVDFGAKCFDLLGLSDADSRLAATVLVGSDERGVHSHGIALLEKYCNQLRHGGINSRPNLRVIRNNGAIALIDGDAGIGQVTACRAMGLAIQKAREFGVGLVSVRNSHHFGAAAYYSRMALEHDMIGVACTNAGVTMTVPGGSERVIGNNPFSMAVPTAGENAIVVDMAMSVASGGKVGRKARSGESIPLGWLVDRVGKDTDDPSQYFRGGALLPIGGHKGFNLALLIEILSGILAGASTTTEIRVEQTAPDRPSGVGHLFGAICIDFFRDSAAFESDLESLLGRLSLQAERDGWEMYVPGRGPSRRSEQARLEGVLIPVDIVGRLDSLATQLGTHAPARAVT